MAISINGITIAGNGKNATINGVNALTLKATGGLTGQQSGDTYTIDGSGVLEGTIVEVDDYDGILFSGYGEFSIEPDVFNKIMDNHCLFVNFILHPPLIPSPGESIYSSIITVKTIVFSFESILSDGSKVFSHTETGFAGITTQSVVFEGNKCHVSTNSPTFVTQDELSETVGNINTLLDTINGEVI